MTLPLITMALTPALLVIWFFQMRDTYIEPIRLIWATFFLGALCVVPSVLVEGALDGVWGRVDNAWVAGYVAAFLGVALPEELAKYAVLFFFCRRLAAFDEPMDGLVYGAAVGAGFAAVENVFYVAYGGTEVAVLRAVTAVPSHGLDGAIMGYFIGLARFVPARRTRFLTQALLVPWILHGFYDWFIAVDRYLPEGAGVVFLDWAAVILVIAVEAGLVLALQNRLRRLQRSRIVGDAANEELLAFHDQPFRWEPWALVLFGGVVLWGSVVVGAYLLMDGLLGALFVLPAWWGSRWFSRGIDVLNIRT